MNDEDLINEIKQNYELKIQALQERIEAKQEQIEAKQEQIEAKQEQIEAKNETIKNLNERISELKEDLKFFKDLVSNYSKQNPIININNENTTRNTKNMSDVYKSKYDQSHAQIGGIVDTAQTGSNQEITQNNYLSEQKQTLGEAAEEIQKLLKQLEETNPTATIEQQQAYVNAAIPNNLKSRCISALQAGWKEAVKEFLDNPYLNVGIAVLEDWQNSK